MPNPKITGPSCHRAAVISHCLWLLLVAGLLVDMSMEKNIPLELLVIWGTVALIAIPVAVYGKIETIRDLLLIDSFLALTLLSFSYFNVTSSETLVCYDLATSDRNPEFFVLGKALYMSIMSDVQNWFSARDLYNASSTVCSVRTLSAVDFGQDRSHVFEIGILVGQAIYAFWLASTTNRQILERQRLEILK